MACEQYNLQRLTTLLNSLRDGSLVPDEQRELSDMLNYFWTTGVTFHENELDEDETMDEESDHVHDVAEDEASEDRKDNIFAQVNDANAEPAEMNERDVLLADQMLAQARVRSCKSNGEGCKLIKVGLLNQQPQELRRGCIAQFTPDEIVAFQMSVKDMNRNARELLILGILSTTMKNGPKTARKNYKVQSDRKKPRTDYCLLDRRVCRDAFRFLLQISQALLTRLHKHYQVKGLTPTIRRAGGRKNNTRSLTMQDTDHVVQFLKNYAEDHAVKLPSHLPEFSEECIRLLPTATRKLYVHQLYASHAKEQGYRVVSRSSFVNVWSHFCPYIIVAKPKVLKY